MIFFRKHNSLTYLFVSIFVPVNFAQIHPAKAKMHEHNTENNAQGEMLEKNIVEIAIKKKHDELVLDRGGLAYRAFGQCPKRPSKNKNLAPLYFPKGALHSDQK